MRTGSQREFEAEAERFAGALVPGERATVIALSGDLGAGKTTFAQTIARHFGIDESVASPTFVIQKTYNIKSGAFARLVHIDAYRLKSAQELEVLGWREISADSKNLIVVEWPERVADLIPHDSLRVSLAFVSEDERDISYAPQ